MSDAGQPDAAADGITVTVIFPSGMISRHLETSSDAQPEQISRAIGSEDDYTAMMASNPGLAASVLAPEDAARRALDAVLAGEPYVVTHGDLRNAITTRAAQLGRAAEVAATDD